MVISTTTAKKTAPDVNSAVYRCISAGRFSYMKQSVLAC